MLAGGILSSTTGFGASVLVVDDPVKGAQEADSAAHRRRVITEYRSTLATRVHPGGSVLLVMTRWHPGDLAGELLDSERDLWRHINIPAVAEAGVPDALGREPGVAMTSALGFTADHFAAARRTSGERAWYALYAGVPAARRVAWSSGNGSTAGGYPLRRWARSRPSSAWTLPTPAPATAVALSQPA